MNRNTNKEIRLKVELRADTMGKFNAFLRWADRAIRLDVNDLGYKTLEFPLQIDLKANEIEEITKCRLITQQEEEEIKSEERKRTLEEVEKAKEVINTRWLEYIKLSFNIVKIGMPFFPFCPKCSCLHPIKVWYGDGNHTCVSCGYTDDNRKFIAI